MVILEVEVDDSTDVEVSADRQGTDHFHEFCRWLGIGLTGVFREIEVVVSVERVLQLLFQLVGRAYPVQNILGGHRTGLVVDGFHPLGLPFIGASVIDHLVDAYKGAPAFGKPFVHKTVSNLLPCLLGHL